MSKPTEIIIVILVAACTIGRLVYQSRSIRFRRNTK